MSDQIDRLEAVIVQVTMECSQYRAEIERLERVIVQLTIEGEAHRQEIERLRADIALLIRFVDVQICECFDEWGSETAQQCDRCRLAIKYNDYLRGTRADEEESGA
jgi:hypothetical protein